MQAFHVISEKYCKAGISLDNIEYAVTAVKFGSNPNHILENLKVGYKSLNDEQANALLKDLFAAKELEIKKKRRSIFIMGICYSIIGFTCTCYILHGLLLGGVLHRSVFVIIAAIIGIATGIFHFTRLLRKEQQIFLLN